jgi:hypothetical protein
MQRSMPRNHGESVGAVGVICSRATWLANGPVLVGIDHGFSFPLRYFEVHHLSPDWHSFLDDFQLHWPTDGHHTCIDFVRDGIRGNGGAQATPAGDASPNIEPAARNRSSISTCSDRWRSRRIRLLPNASDTSVR